MTAAAAQLAPMQTPTDSGGWRVVSERPIACVAMRECVRRTLKSEHYTGKQTDGAARQWLLLLARKARDAEHPPVLYGGELWIPARLHPALYELPSPELNAEILLQLPSVRRGRTLTQILLVDKFHAFMRMPQGRALGLVKARAAFVAQHGGAFGYTAGGKACTLKFSARSLWRWEEKLNRGGLDKLAADSRGQYERARPSEEAVTEYWRLRAEPKRHKIRAVYRMIVDLAERNNWRWFKCYRSCAAWDRANRPTRALTLGREGEDAYRDKCERYIEMDPESYEPGECYVADNTTVDVWVRTPRGGVLRPNLSAVLDWRSRKIVGYRLVEQADQFSILAAFTQAADAHGLPAEAHLDNGRGGMILLHGRFVPLPGVHAAGQWARPAKRGSVET